MQGLTQGRGVLRRLLLLAAALLAQSVLSLAQAAPTVSLTSPGEGWLYNAPANLPLRATATPEVDTTITRVEFYANGNLVGQDATAAYAFNWNGVAAGTYVLTARAIDSTGAEATSAARTVTVSDTNQPPTVSLTAPANNATYALPADITVTASASAVERNGSITQVEFFANDVSIGSVTASPWRIVWSNPTAGSYTLTARATDNLGAQTTSAARTVTVSGSNAAPTVSLTAPANNAKVHAPASLTVSASASGVEANTPVTLVEFFANGAPIGSDTASPWSIGWANPPAGTYTLTARATDSAGAQTTSAPRSLTITDTNTPPTVSLTAPANNAKLYLPASVTVSASASGVEANTPVTLVEFLANGAPIGSATASPWSIAWANPPTGTHTLTARATDSLGAVTTSAARTVVIGETNLPPTVSLTAPANNAAFIAPATITLTANAAAPEANGTVASVEFLANGTPIGSTATKPYTLAWSVTAPGSYQLTARATDEQGASTTSSLRTITVLANQAPAISLTSPTANQSFADRRAFS
jgi:predicted phage tail protein